MISPFLTQRTKSKFVFAGPTRTAETLFKFVKVLDFTTDIICYSVLAITWGLVACCLNRYILPEQVPTQYGGLSVDLCECNPEFSMDDPVTEITLKPATKQTVEITVNEVCLQNSSVFMFIISNNLILLCDFDLQKCSLVWELRVVGWEVSYSAEFVPQRGYTVLIQKSKKMAANDVPVVSDSFSISELGKILLTIDNPTSKKKKLLYRFKVVPLVG